MEFVRVDVWLHAVRLFKTRSAATTAVKGGKIKVDGEPIKPSHKLRVGHTITFRQSGRERIIEVTGLLDKRVGHPVAIKHYADHSPEPIPRYLMAVPRRERGAGRPTKKERRELDKLRGYTNL
ncbi:MAG: RNA-binding S4 domain-containing protein [Yaniella sp.]|mgnify:CR=1 FL=1|uniref:RNA-binding S4 domain-containing protein n=1 Tax=Yaniella sp. TaxID=2773929 RepID=UPI001847B702|nr:RNA-binding S4 domain-containing protein [Yaniella sp.]MDN6456311.1 RNA-binding S4 domain-containing protein [Yaniella sp.]MDN6639072.1 RNA-binding S4 domain-containing protein [Yaniella sp.]NLZ99155.1 RNA-binding S4 domain-containing protein [Micrococcus sp.]